MNLNVKLSKKLGGQAEGQPKIWEGHGPPSSLLEPPLWGYHCSVTYVTRQWRSYHENFLFIVT